MENICINIYNRRTLLGMTQQELADKCGYTDRTTITKLEKGLIDFNTSRLKAIADALQTTIGELFNNPDDANIPYELAEDDWQALRDKLLNSKPHSIYKIENRLNGRVYIGNTTNVESRWAMHMSLLALNNHTAKLMQEDYNNGGEEDFYFEVIEDGLDRDIAAERETLYMVIYRSYDPKYGYNSQDPRFYSKSYGSHTRLYDLLKKQFGVER